MNLRLLMSKKVSCSRSDEIPLTNVWYGYQQFHVRGLPLQVAPKQPSLVVGGLLFEPAEAKT